MKKIIQSILLFVLLFVFQPTIQAQLANWSVGGSTDFPTNLTGQINGFCRITQMKFHPTNPNKLYAVTAEGGFFTTIDGGDNWTVKAGTEFLTGSCASLCIDYTNDQVIYLGSGDPDYYSNGQGLYKSTDGGNTFVATSLTNCLVDEILQDPSNSQTFVVVTNKGIYKSTDNGITWIAKTSTSIPFCDLKQNAANSPTLFACTNESTCRLYRSTDFGSTWTQITSGITTAVNFIQAGGRIAVTPADTNIVYFEAIGGGGILHKSTDGGLNFTVTKPEGAGTAALPYITFYDFNNNNGLDGQGNYNNCIWVDVNNPSKIWIQAHNTWLSTDAGATWSEITHWSTKLHTDMHQLQQSPFDASKLYCCNDGGVWLSTDGGNNWTPKSNGLYAYEIANGAGKSSHTKRDYVIIGTQDNARIYRNASGWFTISGGDDYENKEYDYLPNGGYYYNKNHNTRTKAPGGTTASYGLPAPITSWQSIAFNRVNSELSFLGETNIYRTTNLSAVTPTWTQISTFSKTIMAVHSCIADPNRLYVITSDQKLFVSSNALSASPSFTQYTLPSASGAIASIAAIANNSNTVYISINSKVYVSIDAGANWTNITYNLPNVNHRRILAEDYGGTEELVFIATNNAVYYKKVGQTTWTNYSTNLPGRRAPTDFSMYDNGTNQSLIRYATYGRAIWETSFGNLRTLSGALDVSQNFYCSTGSQVTYNDISNGNITSWSWSFPGGTPSSSVLQNPIITYNSPGLYGASLTVSDGINTSTVSKANMVLVTAGAPTTITSCTVASNSNLNNGFGIGIRLFSLSNINKSSSGNDGVYNDYSCNEWTTLIQGNTYNASITTGTSNNEGARVYIDLNDNGIFETTESLVTFPADNSGTRTLTFTIPSSGVTLNKGLRLRVVSRFNTIPTNACDAGSYGQVEDYTVYILPVPSATLMNGSGSSTICFNQSANVKVNIIGGTSPYTVLLSDGSNTQTISNYISGSNISNTLTTNTSYSLISVTDYFGMSIPVSGSANITVNQTTSNTTSLSACGSYTWPCNGASYTSSGNYTCTSLNGSNCLHTEILVLTITPNTSDTVTASTCNSYTWVANNNAVYTTSGFKSYTVGCITHYLNLTILPNTSDTVSASACTSYTWVVNNNTVYTSSGYKSYTDGCITHYLNLIIAPNTSDTIAATSCVSYTWIANNNTVYTTSGYKSYTDGCATHYLNLTILPNTSDTVSASACTSYTWVANNNTVYTTSGYKSYTDGCITHYLNLTIQPNTSDTVSASACTSYTWVANNNTVYTTSGYKSYTDGCITHYLNLIIAPNASDTIAATSCASYTWIANNNTVYTTSGLKSYVDGCVTHYLNLTITYSGILLSAKAFLNGAYNAGTGLMYDSLRVLNLIPSVEPYSMPPYNKTPIGEAGGETVSSGVLAISGNNAIVDWVFIELRNASNPSIVVANKRALIQRDGDIVSNLDGISPVLFSTLSPGNYFVSVKHRNHLGVMSSNALAFNGCSAINLDLTSTSLVYVNPSITTQARKLVGTIYTLWSGDANNNKNVKYNGLANDKDHILTAIGGANFLNNIVNAYRVEDVNLDGKIKFNGNDNDRILILSNVGINTPNTIINQHTPN